jgi:putative SOS response-associated peptidase YedK
MPIPVRDMADIHDRMPAIIPRELADTWLLESTKTADVIQQARTDIVIERVSPPTEPTLFDMV